MVPIVNALSEWEAHSMLHDWLTPNAVRFYDMYPILFLEKGVLT